MKLSNWLSRQTIATFVWRLSGRRPSRVPQYSPPSRLNVEVLEERWTPSSSIPASLAQSSSCDTSVRAVSVQSALPATDPLPTPQSTTLQALLDGPETIIDLGGQTWVVPDRLTITTRHSGKTIQNGTIKFTFEGRTPRVAGMELVQGRRWWNAAGVMEYFPAGDIDLVLKDLVLDGDFRFDYGLQAYNEYRADALNKGYNLVSTVTNPAHRLVLDNVHFQNSGNSAVAGSFASLIGRDISANRVAKHVLGLRGYGGSYVDIDGLVVINSGSVVDFHNDGSFYDEQRPDVAVVKNIIARNIRGRSKVAGNNWSIDGANWWFKQDSPVNLNLYPAFDLAKNPRRFVVDGFVAINFPTLGIGTLSDRMSGGDIQLCDVHISNSIAGIKVQQDITVEGAEFEGISRPFRSSVPEYSSDVVSTSTQSSAYWASIFTKIDELYATKNAEWGTDYVPRYWVPNSVQVLME